MTDTAAGYSDKAYDPGPIIQKIYTKTNKSRHFSLRNAGFSTIINQHLKMPRTFIVQKVLYLPYQRLRKENF
jgi:hypothetical protein